MVSSSIFLQKMWLMYFVCSIMLGIMFFVICLMVMMIFSKSVVKKFYYNFSSHEICCTLVPIVILSSQVYCSFIITYWDSQLFLGGESADKWLNVKITGNQWYWSYEYVSWGSWAKYDSYMLGSSKLSLGDLRLLEVDMRLVLPMNKPVILSITSADVIHSWSLPDYGLKVDAVPGMENNTLVYFSNMGVFYGMCSEICGTGHSYMPIVVEVVPEGVFIDWMEDLKHKLDIVTRLGDWYNLHGVSSFV
uniref:cytochrome-c oxidase n=1 Tax=Hammerschmidtiella sp. ZengetLiu-2016 TaxID=2025463 RepID=A0A3S6JBR3_9BILA|nr:cytochrome c oxidase subunit 2 [Hammerschmidtiella sp. ZengetLiu-2016]